MAKMTDADKQTLVNFLRDLGINLKTDWLLISFFVGIPIVLSVPLYCYEYGANNPNLHCITDAMYLTWITVTTVGYGDIYPITSLGRTIAGIDAMCGIILFGLVVYHVSKARECVPSSKHVNPFK